MTRISPQAYIIAARRTAIGLTGGLHRHRRVEELAAMALQAALTGARLSPKDVQQLVIGNASEGGNPARLIGLTAGLPETSPAYTIDRQCASGLDAILTAIRLVESGDAEVVAAGGAESLSTAPWRLARPHGTAQTPRFLEAGNSDFEADETLARRGQITRKKQDAYALAARQAGAATGGAKAEIVAMRPEAAEARDEWLGYGLEAAEIADLLPFCEEGGTLTSGNTSPSGDGAAMVVVVSQACYQRLGRPPALCRLASAATGARPGSESEAPAQAVLKLRERLNGDARRPVATHELNESSAAQAIAFRDQLAIPADRFNPGGGALAHGRPFGASSAVVVVRLFARLLASGASIKGQLGLAATGAHGGLGVAALFETHLT